MPPPYQFATTSEFENYLGSDKVQALLDTDNDGTADADRVTRLLRDASSKVAGYLRPIYTETDGDLEAIADDPPGEVVRLTLQVAHVFGAQRHPEIFRQDWTELDRSTERDLMGLRKQLTRLDVVGSPEPRVAAGKGAVVSGTKRPDFW